MAELVSPGVSVTVTDESFYAAAGTGTVPMILIATAQNKTAPDGTGIAAYTTPAQAGKVKLITSQRELLTNYGNPVFKTLGGTPLHGHELNEYGLQAAYSFLGIANRAYVLRADINLDALEARTSPPTSSPAAGTVWVDSSASRIGLKRWNGTDWVLQSVRVLTALEVDGTSAQDNVLPKSLIGLNGEFAVAYVDSTGTAVSNIKIYQKLNNSWHHVNISDTGTTTSWETASGGLDFQVASHTALPAAKSTGSSLAVGDLVLQTTAPNNGTQIVVSEFNSTTGQFVSSNIVNFEHSREAYAAYDVLGGVENGDLWADFASQSATISLKDQTGPGAITLVRQDAGFQDAVLTTTAVHTAGTVALKIIINDNDVVHDDDGVIEVTFNGFDANNDGNITAGDVITAIQSALSAADPALTQSTEILVSESAGFINVISRNGLDVRFEAGNVAGFGPGSVFIGSEPSPTDPVSFSNWSSLQYVAASGAPSGLVQNGTLWYDSLIADNYVDILRNNQGVWETYAGDVNVAASEPTTRSDRLSALQTGDIWVSAADLENYPALYKWTGTAWAAIDSTDQVSKNGIIFADARATPASSLDADAPNAELYPFDILLWNKRASGGNVKQWNAVTNRWVDYSGNKNDGTPYMLRKAQRQAVVRQLQAAIASNIDIRNESNRFNLISCPGYPELLDEMVTLNTDRKETAFIVADAPLRLAADATSVQNWATNTNNAVENGEDGLTTNYTYSAVYYPHGLTSSLDGTNIVVPASHIALRTLAFNDQVAFPWFAPAGFQRGIVTNATSVGYIDRTSGEYVPVSLSEGQRDALYINKVNPIGNFPNRGLVVFGQKTLSGTTSALDRVNVARLVVYIRERLDDIVRPFLFEPNDEITRQNAKVVVDRFLGNLVSQRGLFDFVTVCDTTNNTPVRIDRNELWIDVAIQPTKSVEFIYIPIRVQNTLGQTN
jgi:hypothetical protein